MSKTERSTTRITCLATAHYAMSETICIHTRREQRRLATAVRQAALHATPGEAVALRCTLEKVRGQHITVEQARTRVAEMRREQDARRTPARRAA